MLLSEHRIPARWRNKAMNGSLFDELLVAKVNCLEEPGRNVATHLAAVFSEHYGRFVDGVIAGKV